MPKYKSRVIPAIPNTHGGLSLFYIARAIPVIVVPSFITKYSVLRSLEWLGLFPVAALLLGPHPQVPRQLPGGSACCPRA